MSRAAQHVLLIAPVDLRFNTETAGSNVFMQLPSPSDATALARSAVDQHRALRDLLVDNGVAITVVRGRSDTPDAPFCNNWFSTHANDTLVLYPLLAESRRRERRPELIAMLGQRYGTVLDFSDRELRGSFLESTGSLCLDDVARVAYAALSPRTDRALAEEWADALGYRLVTFTATDADHVPYYHTNVMMFIGHGVAGVCLDSIEDSGERHTVERSLREAALTVVRLTREQVLSFAGNCLPLLSDTGERLLLMSTTAYQAFTPAERTTLERHARLLYTDLRAFEQLGGGSARCLAGELL